jgi:hypothetical protein
MCFITTKLEHFHHPKKRATPLRQPPRPRPRHPPPALSAALQLPLPTWPQACGTVFGSFLTSQARGSPQRGECHASLAVTLGAHSLFSWGHTQRRGNCLTLQAHFCTEAGKARGVRPDWALLCLRQVPGSSRCPRLSGAHGRTSRCGLGSGEWGSVAVTWYMVRLTEHGAPCRIRGRGPEDPPITAVRLSLS